MATPALKHCRELSEILLDFLTIIVKPVRGVGGHARVPRVCAHTQLSAEPAAAGSAPPGQLPHLGSGSGEINGNWWRSSASSICSASTPKRASLRIMLSFAGRSHPSIHSAPVSVKVACASEERRYACQFL